jgi:hypothetical protein
MPRSRIMINHPTPSFLELASTFPHLRELSVDQLTLRINEVRPLVSLPQYLSFFTEQTISQKCLDLLSLLPLHTIRLCLTVVDDPDHSIHGSHAQREQWTGLAMEILKKCPTHGSDVVQKRVIVVENGRSVKTYGVFA